MSLMGTKDLFSGPQLSQLTKRYWVLSTSISGEFSEYLLRFVGCALVSIGGEIGGSTVCDGIDMPDHHEGTDETFSKFLTG